MVIRSLHSVDGIPFGASREALSALGQPQRESVSRLGEQEVHFERIIYRFAEGAFVEASFPVAPGIDLDGQFVEGATLISYLQRHDSGFREAHGFAIAPTLGLAVDLDDSAPWGTAFAAGHWEAVR